MAYLWGWPLVNVANRSAGFAKAPGVGLLGGVIPVAYNRIAMLTDYIDPNQHWGVCPNQDVVYGFGYFGLDKEPIVFQVPDFEERFWVYALRTYRRIFRDWQATRNETGLLFDGRAELDGQSPSWHYCGSPLIHKLGVRRGARLHERHARGSQSGPTDTQPDQFLSAFGVRRESKDH
jgi:Protein of unknown function (DUF1254)